MTELNGDFEIIGDPENSIPKFSNMINFKKLENGSIVMIFFTRQSLNTSPVIIETIIVDENHAKQIVDVLKKTIDKK